MSLDTLDTTRADLTVGIVGAGLMGRGIAQICAQAGITVKLFDTRIEAIAEAKASIASVLARLVEKGKISAEASAATLDRLIATETLEGLADADLVVEAIVENIDVKRSLFQQLEAIVGDHCILASNTSSLSITAIAATSRLPERFAGFHFFSPVPLMKVVEVIKGIRTADWVTESLTALARRVGHTPVNAQDTPGFIVNHAGRGFITEGLRILGESVAPHETIDRILREAAGFRMGPCELLDLTGLDVSQPVMESIYNQYYQEPRFRPSPIARLRQTAGLLGRKTGRGFYTYTNNVAEVAAEAPTPTDKPTSVWVSKANADAHSQIVALLQSLGATLDNGDTPSADALCLVAPLGTDATTVALAEKLDPSRTVAIDTLFALSKRRTLMPTIATSAAYRNAAHGLLASDGVAVSIIRESAGFVAQRVVALVVNIGCDIAQQSIATPHDIDLAVTLGLGYPKGPLGMGDALGSAKILAILQALETQTGDPRYRPSPWLTRRAKLGLSLLTQEK